MRIKLIKPSFEVTMPMQGLDMIKHIERAGRTCYKSEDRITEDSAIDFVKMVVKRGHESVLEHNRIIFEYFIEQEFSLEEILHDIQHIQSETVGLDFTVGHDSVIISMNARTLRDAKRRVNNKLANDLLMEAYKECPVLYQDLVIK